MQKKLCFLQVILRLGTRTPGLLARNLLPISSSRLPPLHPLSPFIRSLVQRSYVHSSNISSSRNLVISAVPAATAVSLTLMDILAHAPGCKMPP